MFLEASFEAKRFFWKSKININNTVEINFDGSPYNYVGEKVLVCHQGKDKNKRAKEKYKARKEVKVEELNIYIYCTLVKWLLSG